MGNTLSIDLWPPHACTWTSQYTVTNVSIHIHTKYILCTHDDDGNDSSEKTRTRTRIHACSETYVRKPTAHIIFNNDNISKDQWYSSLGIPIEYGLEILNTIITQVWEGGAQIGKERKKTISISKHDHLHQKPQEVYHHKLIELTSKHRNFQVKTQHTKINHISKNKQNSTFTISEMCTI